MMSRFNRVNLEKAQRVEIISLVDNFVDMFLSDGEAVKRPPRAVFLDAGFSERGLMRNLDILEIELGEVEAIVLSHGHPDHRAALMGLIARIGKKRLPIVVHPDAFLKRSTILKSDEVINQPPLQEAELIREGAPLFIRADGRPAQGRPAHKRRSKPRGGR